MSHRDYHAWLYKVATGWLGWLPQDAYNSDMADIETAHAGRIDMLKAIFGSGDGKSEDGPKLSLADKFRAAMSKRGTEKVVTKP